MCIDARRDMEEKLRKERDSQKAALEAAAARFATSLWSSVSMSLSGLQCPHQYQCPPHFHSQKFDPGSPFHAVIVKVSK